MNIEIYELIDPRDGKVRYVGQSRNALKRYKWHLGAAKRGEPYRVYNWIRLLQSMNLEPEYRIVDVVDESKADEIESKLIERRMMEGLDLTNLTFGGGGLRGLKHSEETKRRIGNAHRGKEISASTRSLMSKINKGRKHTPEHIEKVRIASIGRTHTPEQCVAISKRMMGNTYGFKKGHQMSLEGREKLARDLSGGSSTLSDLTNEQAIEIRKLAASGIKQRAIAIKYGVGEHTISKIVLRKTYKHAEEDLEKENKKVA